MSEVPAFDSRPDPHRVQHCALTIGWAEVIVRRLKQTYPTSWEHIIANELLMAADAGWSSCELYRLKPPEERGTTPPTGG